MFDIHQGSLKGLIQMCKPLTLPDNLSRASWLLEFSSDSWEVCIKVKSRRKCNMSPASESHFPDIFLCVYRAVLNFFLSYVVLIWTAFVVCVCMWVLFLYFCNITTKLTLTKFLRITRSLFFPRKRDCQHSSLPLIYNAPSDTFRVINILSSYQDSWCTLCNRNWHCHSNQSWGQCLSSGCYGMTWYMFAPNLPWRAARQSRRRRWDWMPSGWRRQWASSAIGQSRMRPTSDLRERDGV